MPWTGSLQIKQAWSSTYSGAARSHCTQIFSWATRTQTCCCRCSNAGFLFFGTLLRLLAARQQDGSLQGIDSTALTLPKLQSSVDGIILDSAPAFITPDIASRYHWQQKELRACSGICGQAMKPCIRAGQGLGFSPIEHSRGYCRSQTSRHRCRRASVHSALLAAPCHIRPTARGLLL